MLIAEILMALVEAIFWCFGAFTFRDEARPTGRIEREESLALKIKGRCAYCRSEAGVLVACGTCRVPLHRDCKVANGGCAVYGCRQR